MRIVPDMRAVPLYAKCVLMGDLRQYFRRGLLCRPVFSRVVSEWCFQTLIANINKFHIASQVYLLINKGWNVLFLTIKCYFFIISKLCAVCLLRGHTLCDLPLYVKCIYACKFMCMHK